MPNIKPDDYNSARSTLVLAGSKSAGKSHPKHNTDSCPEEHGKSLLQEARDEFQESDKKGVIHRAGMTFHHYDAIHKAATKMGVTKW